MELAGLHPRGGIVQVAVFRSTSAQVMPRTSPDLQAVNASSSKANFTEGLTVDPVRLLERPEAPGMEEHGGEPSHGASSSRPR